jgi:starch synthase
VDAPALYDRGGNPYQDDGGADWKDNALRFGVLSRVGAMLGSIENPLKWRPDVIHGNDWPAALVPAYLAFAEKPRAASLLTIHNLAFQGTFSFADVRSLALPPQSLTMEGAEFYGKVSFLKAGIVYSSAITTVSPTYAREIQTPELGFGLDGVLRMRSNSLHGVLNGIDGALWNPATDSWLAKNYDATRLEDKRANKAALKARLGISGPDDVPLAGIVSRLAHQKGIDLIAEAAPQLAKIPVQVAIVGAGEREMVDAVNSARAKHSQTIGAYIGFDEGLAHLLEAGSDMFLMPSRFEPCGMNQMYSQRYGTPPIANATGGLVDTIVDERSGKPGAATGFLMRKHTVACLVEEVQRAVSAWREPTRWRRLQANGMAHDFGWGPSARAYAEIYARIRSTS